MLYRENRRQLLIREEYKGRGLPDGFAYVGKTTKWATPYLVHQLFDGTWGVVDHRDTSHWYAKGLPSKREAQETAVALYKENFSGDPRFELGGKHLVCDCELDEPCHADVLLEIVNGGQYGF